MRRCGRCANSFGHGRLHRNASVAVPLLKLVGLAWLLLSTRLTRRRRLADRTRLYRVIERVSRWSAVDIIVAALLTALVTLGNLAMIEPGLGVLVRLPGVTDRPQMVEGTSANTVFIREDERWAEPIDQMVPRVLRQDLARVSNGRITNDRVAVGIDQFMAFGDDTVRKHCCQSQHFACRASHQIDANSLARLMTVSYDIRAGVLSDRSQSFKDLSMSFYGYNRDGTPQSDGVREGFRPQGMMRGFPAAQFCINNFHGTDMTEDLKRFDVPKQLGHAR